MKFSYKFVKKLLPALKSKKEIVNLLNNYSYETEDLEKDVFDIKIPANRFSDSASHIGVAREISAVLNLNFNFNPKFLLNSKEKKDFEVKIQEKNLCPRYMALRFDNVVVQKSPPWLQDILRDCGLKPINNLVDIVNYVMLLTGEPMHVFDFDKLEGKQIIVRRARRGEKILTLDGEEIKLDEGILVIADAKKPVAIAGIKGGMETGVDKNTKRVLVEAANFDPALIYKTYKKIGLPTDAALRFSHRLSLNLPAFALWEAALLFKDIAFAKMKGLYDSLGFKEVKERKIIKFDINKFNTFIGINLDKKKAYDFLRRLGFQKIREGIFLTPHFRLDIEDKEDLFEEIARLYGYNLIKPQPPHLSLVEIEEEEMVLLKEKIKEILIKLGLVEVFTYSFISEEDKKANGWDDNDLWQVENYISEEFKYLRPNLGINLQKTALYNLRFFDEVKIFEMGSIFSKKNILVESNNLGVVFASKKKDNFLELKGILNKLFEELGISDFEYKENGKVLEIKGEGKVVGVLEIYKKENYFLSKGEIYLEELLKLEKEEREFEPLAKFPLVVRDVSFLIDRKFKIGEVIEMLSRVSLKYIEDIDLIDEYFDNQLGENKQSLTLRIVLNPQDHTFSKEEIDNILQKITKVLEEKFDAEIR